MAVAAKLPIFSCCVCAVIAANRIVVCVTYIIEELEPIVAKVKQAKRKNQPLRNNVMEPPKKEQGARTKQGMQTDIVMYIAN